MTDATEAPQSPLRAIVAGATRSWMVTVSRLRRRLRWCSAKGSGERAALTAAGFADVTVTSSPTGYYVITGIAIR